MRSDVHHAALRAAAKVAFSVAFLSGCSSPVTPGDVGEDDALDETPAYGEGEVGTSESDLSGKKKRGSKAEQLTSACHEDASTAPPLTCDQIVNAAFPTVGNYPGTKQSVSAEVQTCCAELLTSSGGMTDHRWDCCANLPDDAGQGTMIACTPWGPPVPPSMNRRRNRAKRVATAPDAWVARAEVA